MKSRAVSQPVAKQTMVKVMNFRPGDETQRITLPPKGVAYLEGIKFPSPTNFSQKHES